MLRRVLLLLLLALALAPGASPAGGWIDRSAGIGLSSNDPWHKGHKGASIPTPDAAEAAPTLDTAATAPTLDTVAPTLAPGTDGGTEGDEDEENRGGSTWYDRAMRKR